MTSSGWLGFMISRSEVTVAANVITCGVLSVSEGELESFESNETSWLVNAEVPEDRELSQ